MIETTSVFLKLFEIVVLKAFQFDTTIFKKLNSHSFEFQVFYKREFKEKVVVFVVVETILGQLK